MSTTSPLTTNTLSPTTKLAGNKRDNKEDLELVKELCDYLKKVVIVELVSILYPHSCSRLKTKDMLNGKVTPTEGETLSYLMHKRGVNIRYLGHVTKLIAGHQTKSPMKAVLLVRRIYPSTIANSYRLFATEKW